MITSTLIFDLEKNIQLESCLEWDKMLKITWACTEFDGIHFGNLKQGIASTFLCISQDSGRPNTFTRIELCPMLCKIFRFVL